MQYQIKQSEMRQKLYVPVQKKKTGEQKASQTVRQPFSLVNNNIIKRC